MLFRSEARKLGIPVVAVVDTNCDPHVVTFPIPGNDDALRAIRLFTSKIADSVIEGQAMAGEAGVLPVAVEAAPAAVGETLSAGSGYLPPDGASDAGDLDASRA